jgi:hypothetical protein
MTIDGILTKIKHQRTGLIILFSALAAGWPFDRIFAAGVGSSLKNVETFGQKAGYNVQQTNVQLLVGKIIGAISALLGTVFVVLIVYAGFLWMTAQGNEEQVGKAKKMIVNSVIGIAIVLMAYAITSFVIAALPG